jgi:sterol desaturase/sphingolipid hydroxylase (fatty acid hydroxylase superfamily)
LDLIRHLLHDLPDPILQLIRLSLWLALLLLVFVPLERLVALHGQKLFRPGFRTDLAYFFISGMVPRTLLVLPVALLAWLLHFLVPPGLHEAVAGLPIWLRFALALVVGELGFYWGHRWSHEIPLLWRFHAVHHSAPKMDWLVNTRAHPVDLIFTRLCGFIPLYLLGFAQPSRGGAGDVILLTVILIGTSWGFFIHSNLRWRLSWLGWLLSTPAFHHWHHTRSDHRDRNYASMLPVFDRVFGTFYLPRHWPAEYGTETPVPPDLAGQLIQPLRRRTGSGPGDATPATTPG